MIKTQTINVRGYTRVVSSHMERKLPESIRKIFKKYNTYEKARNRCHFAADEIVREIKKINIKKGLSPYYNIKVYAFSGYNPIHKSYIANHIVVKWGEYFLDPTNIQFGCKRQIYTYENIPLIYKSINPVNTKSFGA